MGIRLIILDGDGVLWDHQDLSALSLPFSLIDQDTIVDANGEKVCLIRGIRELLKSLVKQGVIVTLASWNKPEHVTWALQLFRIDRYFRVVEARFHPEKHLMIKSILKRLIDEGVTLGPNEILYVDDRTVHLVNVRKEVGDVHFLQMHVDIKNPLEIVKYLRAQGRRR
ncbi:MAG: Acid Phosphatase [Candidatus Bathyarchaeota archaeon BA1]|nr:MAG: Acid Phosphatase [Candidatus Bathyarchaeota archaeon BA1]